MCSHDNKIMQQISFPSKKVFGNQNVAFVQRRQAELENYMQRLLSFYPRPPPVLARFVHWDKHEVHGITASLSAYLFQVGCWSSRTSNEVKWGSARLLRTLVYCSNACFCLSGKQRWKLEGIYPHLDSKQ